VSAASGRAVAPPSPETSFINDLEYSFDVSADRLSAAGQLHLVPELRSPSGRRPRLSVIATVTDIMIGVTACFHTLPKVAVTVDMSILSLAPTDSEHLAIEIELLKIGQSVTTAELRCVDDAGVLVVTGFMNFAVTRHEVAHVPEPMAHTATSGSMTRPFLDHAGLTEREPGDFEIEIVSGRSNAVGGLMGGLVTLLGEVAAERLHGHDVTELEIRFMHSVAVGPGRARARALSADVVRAEVRDPGRGDRVCAVLLAKTAP
jgi:acyl-coenzyme A thioesterase PaaI-like protein